MRPGGSHDCAAAGVVPGVAVEVGDGGAGGLAEEDAGGVIPNIGAEAHGAAEDAGGGIGQVDADGPGDAWT